MPARPRAMLLASCRSILAVLILLALGQDARGSGCHAPDRPQIDGVGVLGRAGDPAPSTGVEAPPVGLGPAPCQEILAETSSRTVPPSWDGRCALIDPPGPSPGDRLADGEPSLLDSSEFASQMERPPRAMTAATASRTAGRPRCPIRSS